MEPTPIRRVSSGGLALVPPEGPEEESPRRRLFASAAKDIVGRGASASISTHHLAFPLAAAAAGSAPAASTPPALASLLTPLAGGSPQALCCAGVSPRALFGGGRSMNLEAASMTSSKRELLPVPPYSSPAVDTNDKDADADGADQALDAAAADERANNNAMGGLVAATHAETSAFAARWDFDVTSGSPLAGGRWEWLTTARKNAAEAAAAAAAQEEEDEEAAAAAASEEGGGGGGGGALPDLALRPKAPPPSLFPSACCASDVTSFPMTTSPPESDRASASPAPSGGGGGGAAAWPVA